ncbi:MAG: hypothetical protein ACF8GE_03220 [Phycisphaerales bacterium JB043]
MPELSEHGRERRDAIRELVVDSAPGLAHRRRQNALAMRGALGTCLLVIVSVPFLTRAPSGTPVAPSDRHPVTSITTRVTTDASIVDRLAFQAASSPSLQTISDEQLLSELHALGIETGLIRQDNTVILTGDVLAARQTPIDQTGES